MLSSQTMHNIFLFVLEYFHMELKATFGILSAFFTFAGLIPYFLEIHKKEIYPHNLSWLGWAFITFVGAIAMLDGGFSWSVIILFANSLSCLIVVIYSIYKKVGVWSTTIYDYIFFGLGIFGIILWQTFNMPIMAILCAVLADLFFGIPTIIKAYKNPKSEIYLAWLSCSIAGLLSLFAVRSYILTEFLYPLYLFIFDTSILLIVLLFKKNNN
jgi:hypothetical protein